VANHVEGPIRHILRGLTTLSVAVIEPQCRPQPCKSKSFRTCVRQAHRQQKNAILRHAFSAAAAPSRASRPQTCKPKSLPGTCSANPSMCAEGHWPAHQDSPQTTLLRVQKHDEDESMSGHAGQASLRTSTCQIKVGRVQSASGAFRKVPFVREPVFGSASGTHCTKLLAVTCRRHKNGLGLLSRTRECPALATRQESAHSKNSVRAPWWLHRGHCLCAKIKL